MKGISMGINAVIVYYMAILLLAYYVLCEASDPSIVQAVADLIGRTL